MAKQKAKNLCRKATYMNRCVLKGVSNISTFITISIRTIVQLSYIFLFFYLKQNQFLFYQSFRFLRICYWKDSLFCCLFVGTPIEKWVCHKSKLDAIRGKIFFDFGNANIKFILLEVRRQLVPDSIEFFRLRATWFFFGPKIIWEKSLKVKKIWVLQQVPATLNLELFSNLLKSNIATYYSHCIIPQRKNIKKIEKKKIFYSWLNSSLLNFVMVLLPKHYSIFLLFILNYFRLLYNLHH